MRLSSGERDPGRLFLPPSASKASVHYVAHTDSSKELKELQIRGTKEHLLKYWTTDD